MTHICVSKLTIIGSDNGLAPSRRQAIIWTNDGIMLIRTLGTNFSGILRWIHSFSFRKMHLKMSSAKCRLFCLGLNELTTMPVWGFTRKKSSLQLLITNYLCGAVTWSVLHCTEYKKCRKKYFMVFHHCNHKYSNRGAISIKRRRLTDIRISTISHETCYLYHVNPIPVGWLVGFSWLNRFSNTRLIWQYLGRQSL